MKKLTTLFLCVMMLATLAVSTSAAGEIYWHEDFSDKFTNPNNWILEGNEFFCDDYTDESNPCIAAYDPGRVCQMAYNEDLPIPRKYTNCAMVTRVQIRDFDSDRTFHGVGLWWRDEFYANPDELGVELGEVYNLWVNADTMELELWEEGLENPLMTAPITEGVEVGGDWFTLGWRIVPGRITCYLNDKLLIDYQSANVVAAQKSPILLLNSCCYSAWDDVVVASADYNLFNESEVVAPPATDNTPTQPVETTTRKEVVTVTDAEGNAVTDAEGNNVTEEIIVTDAPAADTNTGAPQGGSSTNTGDAAFIVVAVMIAALGCAVVVEKVNVR